MSEQKEYCSCNVLTITLKISVSKLVFEGPLQAEGFISQSDNDIIGILLMSMT